MNKRDFSKRLILLMDEHKVTVRNAAKLAGIAPSTIQNWRSGHMPTDFIALRKLASILNVTLSFMLTGEDDSRPTGARPSITEFFVENEPIFDGYAHVIIKKLRPR